MTGALSAATSFGRGLAPTFGAVSTVAWDLGGTDTCAINYPSGIVANHLLVAFAFADRSGVGNVTGWNTPSGWTKIVQVDVNTSYSACCWYKVAVGSESGTLSFSCTSGDSSSAVIGQMARYAGVALSGSITEASGGNSGTSTAAAPASITTTNTNELCICLIAARNAVTVSAITGMTGGTWTESAAEQNVGGGASLDFQHAGLGAAGVLSGGSATLGSSQIWKTLTFAVNPS